MTKLDEAIRHLLGQPERNMAGPLLRWPAIPAVVQSARIMIATRRGSDQFTVNETNLGRRLGTFDESFSTTSLTHSQFSAARHVKAERIARKTNTLDEERGRAIDDDADEEIETFRSSPAGCLSLVSMIGPPAPGFKALGSGAPTTLLTPPMDVDVQNCLAAPVPVTCMTTAAMTVAAAASPERAVATNVAAQQLLGDDGGGSGGDSNSSDVVHSVLSTRVFSRIRTSLANMDRAKQAGRLAATPKRTSAAPVPAQPLWRSLSGVIVMLGFVLSLAYAVMIGYEVQCTQTVFFVFFPRVDGCAFVAGESPGIHSRWHHGVVNQSAPRARRPYELQDMPIRRLAGGVWNARSNCPLIKTNARCMYLLSEPNASRDRRVVRRRGRGTCMSAGRCYV